MINSKESTINNSLDNFKFNNGRTILNMPILVYDVDTVQIATYTIVHRM